MQALEWAFILCAEITKFIEKFIHGNPINLLARGMVTFTETLPCNSNLTLSCANNVPRKASEHYMQSIHVVLHEQKWWWTPSASKFYGPNGTRSTKPDGSFTTSRSARSRHLNNSQWGKRANIKMEPTADSTRPKN